MKKNKKLPTTKSGFGILEALVASGIIAIFAGGVVILGNMALRSVVINKHRLQAAYLSQEGVELVKNIRDSNWVDENKNTGWNSGIDDSGGNSRYLDQDTTTDKWELISGDKTIILNKVSFTREIRITNPTNSDLSDVLKERAADIEVKVRWDDYGKQRDVTINSTITDWMIY